MCDTAVALGSVTIDGVVRFAKNSDRESDEPQYLDWVAARDHTEGAALALTWTKIPQVAHTRAMLLSKAAWMWGAEIGCNEQGLVIGNEAVLSPIPASLESGIIGMDYVRLALERAGSVDEAIETITRLLREHGQSGNCGFRRPLAYHNAYLLADSSGAKVLETVDREWVVQRISEYAAISNALTTEDSFSSSSASVKTRAIEAGLYDPAEPFNFSRAYGDATRAASAIHRRARALGHLARHRGLGTSDLFQLLRDHREPGADSPAAGARICAHSRTASLGQTTASWVSCLAPDRRVHWVTATAAPCTGVFKPILLGAGLPRHGPVPRVECDEASLWWRHETLRRYLEGDTEARAIFESERDALEARFIEHVEDPARPQDPEADRVLIHSCWREAIRFESQWLDSRAKDRRRIKS